MKTTKALLFLMLLMITSCATTEESKSKTLKAKRQAWRQNTGVGTI